MLTLEAGRLRASILPELGAGLADFSLLGPLGHPCPILRRSPPAPAGWGDLACFVMAPWTNRIANARFSFDGAEHVLRPNFADGSAIHGVACPHPWRVTDRSPVSARLSFESTRHDTGFPFPFGAAIRYELSPEALTIDLAITNLAETPMPAGCGLHPFFQRRLWDDTDEVEILAPVRGRYPCEAQLPREPALPDEVSDAISRAAPLGNPGLDDVFDGFTGRAELHWPASRVRLTMTTSPEHGHLVVFAPRTGHDPTAPGTPASCFCVEPCTMVNDGFNLLARGWDRTGVRVLAPGERLATRIDMRVDAV